MMPKEKKTSVATHSRGEYITSSLGAKVKFCVTQHSDILYDSKPLLFPDLLVLTCIISTPK